MSIIHCGDKVALISCSDGRSMQDSKKIDLVQNRLETAGLNVIRAKTIFQTENLPFSGSPKERADELMQLFLNPTVQAVFDISGGDSANQILPYVNFEMIAENKKPFVGISDLSVLLNAIYVRSNIETYHYRINNLAGSHAVEQMNYFEQVFLNNEMNNPSFTYEWLRGKRLEGTVIGGNIRCFLKLAGTPYFPDPQGKILFLESLGGGVTTIASLLAQLEQLQIFAKCNGIILGTFSYMESKQLMPTVEELVLEVTKRYNLPVIRTKELGHGENAKCIQIGKFIEFK